MICYIHFVFVFLCLFLHVIRKRQIVLTDLDSNLPFEEDKLIRVIQTVDVVRTCFLQRLSLSELVLVRCKSKEVNNMEVGVKLYNKAIILVDRKEDTF